MIKKLKIGAFIYEIIYDDNVTRENGNRGSVHLSNNKIFIDKTMNKDHQIKTLIHEVLHVLIANGGNLIINKNEVEEHLVDFLCYRLYEFLKDNHDFFKLF